MKASFNKIVVSHSGKQYVHQLLQALKNYNLPFTFYTSFAYLPTKKPFNLLKFLPLKIRLSVEKELRKRYFGELGNNLIKQLPWFELMREISDKLFNNKFSETMLFKRDRLHDFWVSKKIKNESFVIGYEECCRDTFKQAKKKGIITILDLAQIHYKEIETISKDFPVFSEIYKNKNLRNKINSIKREEIELADYIMCLSTFAKESLIKYGYPSHRIFVVNLGFDPLKFKPKKTYSQTGKLKIVYAGTITKRKGIDLLLKLNSELSDLIELTFIGPMADAADIFKKEGNYKWYPYLDHDELNKVFNEQDVFIFPSYLDSWAMVVIEAMACGLPVVISANTGAKDSIQKNEGFIVEPGNYQSLKEKVLYLHSNRSICEAMGRQAHIQAQKYTWAAYQIQVQEVLKKIGNLRFY